MSEIILRKFVSPEIIFGEGSRKLAGKYAGIFRLKKVLIVTDPGVMASGWVNDITNSLFEQEIDFSIFSSVSQNPREIEVMNGAAFYKENGCDGIIAVGGGSPMDCAKGIGIITSNGKHILDFKGVDTISLPCPPLIFIPTTAGTSADVSQFAIVSDTKERVKIAIISKAIVPDIALIDPETTITMSPYLTACTGVDALTHAIEAFVSKGSSPITDIHALAAIKLLYENLPKAINNGNSDIRNNIMLGSMEAGLAFSNAILGAVHAMSHSLGGFLDLPHGECNSIILEHVIAFNYDTVPEKYNKIGEEIGLNLKGLTNKQKKEIIINSIIDLKQKVGITKKLGEAGVNISDISELSKKAVNDPCLITNPKTANKRDIEVIYEEAY